MINVLIADDHTIFREGLKPLLDKEIDISVSGEASNYQEVINQVIRNDHDVLVLDISMPGRNGIEILKELKQMAPKLHVLILTMHPEEEYAVRAIRAGADGYLTKKKAVNELVEAIRTVAKGIKYISPSLADKLAHELESTHSGQLHERLSDREYQIMCMIASGKTVSQIAVDLSLSVPTISTYRSRILKKMNLKNNAEITHYAIKNGLAP